MSPPVIGGDMIDSFIRNTNSHIEKSLFLPTLAMLNKEQDPYKKNGAAKAAPFCCYFVFINLDLGFSVGIIITPASFMSPEILFADVIFSTVVLYLLAMFQRSSPLEG